MGDKLRHNFGKKFERKIITPRFVAASFYITKKSASFKRNMVSMILNQMVHSPKGFGNCQNLDKTHKLTNDSNNIVITIIMMRRMMSQVLLWSKESFFASDENKGSKISENYLHKVTLLRFLMLCVLLQQTQFLA